jgi:endonuclease/exonuclease/phosphatase family metal-dependent hydrolase
MPSFPKPKFPYTVNLASEIKALRAYRKKDTLAIPESKPNSLLIATWNIANLGEQDRQPEHFKIIAEIISWFDLVAIQETKENLKDILDIAKYAGKQFKLIFSDEGGNNERMVFIYRSNKVSVLNEVAELAISPKEYSSIKLPGITGLFKGFDRTPYMVSFQVKDFRFCLLDVHLYFGKENETASIDRRCLEAYCIARWADLRSKSRYAYTTNVFALGDFNLPKIDKKDKVYKALLSKGLELPQHSTKVYSNINNDKAYDQIAFLPGLQHRVTAHGIFPFDNAVFADLYKSKSGAQFRSYVKYYLSDHRPLWMEIDIKT